MAMINAVNEFLDDLRGGRMSDSPVVKVEQGELQGRLVASPSGKSFYSFQGIPYAKPPLGSLRFKAPQPPESWEGIRDATSEGNMSAQINIVSKEYNGDENCLFLNINTPNLDGEFLPVMIYIHGGGFRYGSGNSTFYGPDFLVEKDVVVVTLNYRLGALGFLSLNTPEVPGNAGLKDIVQAIRWVKQNIHNFGGNSGNITIFGQSAGGVASSVIAASPLTKNLISKAIVQSGNGLNSWAFQKNPVENARLLAKELGCESNEVDEIFEFLMTTPVKDIVEAHDRLQTPEVFYNKGQNIFSLVVENEFPDVEAVLTEPFIDVVTSGRIAEVPYMIGSTSLEFTSERYTDDLQAFIPEELSVQRNSPEAVAIAEKIKELYFKGNPTGVESLNEHFELVSDKLVNIGTHRYIQYLVKATNKPIYYYKFDYVGELNISKKVISSFGLTHAGHMDELGYLFKNSLHNDVEATPEDIKMRERLVRLWTNFAKSGNPTPEENTYITATWLPINQDNLYYLNLSNELSLGTNPNKDKMDFWDELYVKHYKIWEQPKPVPVEITRKLEHIVVEEPVEEKAPEVKAPEVKAPEIVDEKLIETTQVEESSEITQEVSEVVTQVISESVTHETKVVHEEEKHEIKNEVEVEPVKEAPVPHVNGNGIEKKVRPSNEIKMVQRANGEPRDVIRANDPPEDDLPKNIGVNKFVNFFESLGGKK